MIGLVHTTVGLIADECDESRVIRISHILDRLVQVQYRATRTQEDLKLVAMTTTRTIQRNAAT